MDEIDLLKGFRDDMPEPTTDAWLRARAAIAAASAESGRSRGPHRGVKLRAPWFRPVYALTLTAVAVVSAIAGALLTQVPASTGPAAGKPAAGATSGLFTKVAAAIHGDANYIVYTQSTTTLVTGLVNTWFVWDVPWTGLPGTQVEQVGKERENGSLVTAWSLNFKVPQTDQLKVGSGNECRLAPIGVTVDYYNHTWQAAPPPCVTLPPGLDMLSPGLRIIAYPVVDGQKTIELQQVSEGETFKLWISQSRHLPLASQTIKYGQWTEQEQYTFLEPVAANLDQLKLDVPRTFTQTPAQRAAS